MTYDPSGGRPPDEQHQPWASPVDRPEHQPGADWADPAGGAPAHAPQQPGGADWTGPARAYPPEYPASPWETAGTAAGEPPYGYGYGYPPPRRTNTMAIVAMILSLVGFATCLTAPVGAILGHVARRQIRETGEEGEGFALTAIIVGWIVTGLMVLVCGLYVAFVGFLIAQEPNL